MIDIITPDTAHRHLPALSLMHRLRHEVFVEKMGWDVPSTNGLEFDQFDAGDATYLLYRDRSGAVGGCVRLLPTTVSYMFRDVPSFRPLLEGQPAPNDPRIWESSRFAATSPRAAAILLCGMCEHALASGVTEIVTVYDIRIERLVRRCGCEPTWKSRVHPVGNTKAIAGRFPTNWEMLSSIRTASGITGPVIRNAPWLMAAMAAE